MSALADEGAIMSQPRRFERVLILLLDSVGVGALPDAASYGPVDADADTLGNVARATPGFVLPNLERLGLGRVSEIQGVPPIPRPAGHHGRMMMRSSGKDTTTGHWEIAGVVLDEPFSVWPEGFSEDILDAFRARSGFEVIGNKAASGTEIIRELGAEHLDRGALIVYTSADSVFQIAAHEERVPLEELYRACMIAREILEPHRVARVIARPFLGEPGAFKRTYNRKDFSMAPPGDTLLDSLQSAGVETVGVGKIKSIFADRGVTRSLHTSGNDHGIQETLRALSDTPRGLVWTNLVDFDMLYGHRNDVPGYARALQETDAAIPDILSAAGRDTLVFITADHGCDPTLAGSTDHTRELVPLLAWHAGLEEGGDLGTRPTMADLGQTIAENFGITLPDGTSFLQSL
jgi:phosphopentomutase